MVFFLTIRLGGLSGYILMPLTLTELMEIWNISVMLRGSHRKMTATFSTSVKAIKQSIDGTSVWLRGVAKRRSEVGDFFSLVQILFQ